MYMLGDQTLFGDDGGRGYRGQGVRGNCYDITTNRLQGSTFQSWIPELWMRLDSGFHGLDSGFQGLYSGFQSPGFQLPKAKNIGFRIPDSLTWGELVGCPFLSQAQYNDSFFQPALESNWSP